jgi:hypothetical protein
MYIEEQLASRHARTIALEDVEDQLVTRIHCELQAGESRILQAALLEDIWKELSKGPAASDSEYGEAPGRWSATSTISTPSFSTMSRSTSRTTTPAKNRCTQQAVDNHPNIIKRKKGRSSAFSRLLSDCFSA